MIVERGGKTLTNQSTILGEIVLKNVADFSNQSLLAKQIQKGLRSLSDSNLYQAYEDPQNGDLTFSLKIMPGTPWRVRACPAHCVADFAQQ